MQDYFGEFRIPIEEIPEAKKWKVGKEYKITTEVEQMGVNKERDYGNEPMMVKSKKKPKYKTFVTFKVKGVSTSKSEALKHKLHESKETKEEEEDEHEY